MVDKVKRHPWKSISVGDEIDSHCTRCREETIHRVVAMVEGKVHLVICTRCGGQHRYRPSPSARSKRVPLPSERQARLLKKIAAAEQKPLQEWQNLRDLAGQPEPLAYDQSASYCEEQAIAHPVFGLGFVRRLIGAFKVEVVFQYEVKILAMNRPRRE
ncbi:MAG: hypothetical protein ACLFVT_02410 [Syntrophobacteria bacterium]